MTGQVSEEVTYEGIELPLLCEPKLPKGEPRLIRVSDEEARHSEGFCFTTACWRNYVAEWKVQDGRLYLASVRGIYRLADGPPLFAAWYTGVLRMAAGRLVDYFHGGHLSRYEREFFAEVEAGLVVRTWNERHYPEPESADDA